MIELQQKDKRPQLSLAFEIAIVEHCNLNCKGCAHFSPISKPYFMSVETYYKDIERISYLFSGRSRWIHIMGGEPLLHPKIEEFLNITRKFFPRSRIDIVTNGLLIEKQKDSFWEACRINKVDIRPTKYPIKIDYSYMESISKSNNVKLRYYNDPRGEKKLTKYVLDIEGMQNKNYSFSQCDQGNKCITLKEGKLFTCPIIPYSNIFNNYFYTNLEISNNDYIDIYKASNRKEILQFLANAPDFCKYCNFNKVIYNNKWDTSACNINEWI